MCIGGLTAWVACIGGYYIVCQPVSQISVAGDGPLQDADLPSGQHSIRMAQCSCQPLAEHSGALLALTWENGSAAAVYMKLNLRLRRFSGHVGG